MSCSQGWGEEPWGQGPWGGGPGAGPLQIASVAAQAENVVRVEFTENINYTNIHTPDDAANVTNWAVLPLPSSKGENGQQARPVTVVTVTRPPIGDVPAADYDRFVDLTLDRPMTPYPSNYELRIVGAIFTADLIYCLEDVGVYFFGVFKKLQDPSIETRHGSRDIANPQTLTASQEVSDDPLNNHNLGTYVIGSDGDYAFDEGVSNFKKRVLRRLVTAQSGFTFLPGYGAGVPQQSSKLGQSITLSQIVVTCESQILKEPDVVACKVTPDLSKLYKGIVRLNIVSKTKNGSVSKLSVPFATT